MAQISQQSKTRLRPNQQQNMTFKSSIFERRDYNFHHGNDPKQIKNQLLHPLSGSNFSLPGGTKQGNPENNPESIKHGNKQMSCSSMFGMEQKGLGGSLFNMARQVTEPVDEDEYLRAEKEKNKYSFLQVPRPNAVKITEGKQDELKAMGSSIIYQRKPFKAPSFLKKDTKSSIDPEQKQPETPFRKPQTSKLNSSKKIQSDANSQAESKNSKQAEANTSQNLSPVLIRNKFVPAGSPMNSSDSKNISTNEPKQSSLNNTLLDPKMIPFRNPRKGSMIIQNQKQFYTPTEKNSAKLGSSHFVQISQKYNTMKNQNKSQFLMIHEQGKNINSLSPKLDDKKVQIPSFIKFKEKKNEVIQKSTADTNDYIRTNTSTSLQKFENKITLDSFQIKDRLGKGAFGDVYLARQKHSGFFCVLKKLSKKKIKQQNTQQLILREIKIQSFLTHRHITNLYGFFDDEEFIYLVMEYMSDGSLAQRFNRKKVPQRQVASFVKQICEALKFMHIENIIHRDIKPDNVFIHEDYIKLGDFGCSVFSDSKRNTMVGSLAYFSPEQLNNQSYDEKIDVWSVGILCYQLLTGRSPFEEDIRKIARQQIGAKLSELRFPSKIQLSEEAKDFTRKLLEETPENRFSISETLKHPFIVKNNIVENLICSTELNLRQN